MKILYYNWIPFDDPAKRGGGVTLYQRNIIEYLFKNTRHQIYFISSGREFSDQTTELYIEETSNIFGDKCRSYTIINSPVLATGNYLDEQDLKIYLEDMSLYHLLKIFFEEQGGFDVIHFNNFEGLSLNVLKLKECFPLTRFIYSLHNYYPFCTQVNFWKNGEKNCDGYDGGLACAGCHSSGISSGRIRKKLALSRDFADGFYTQKEFAKKIKKAEEDFSADNALSGSGRKWEADFQRRLIFKEVRKQNICFFNKYMDHILAVSRRTHEIALDMGLLPDLVTTDYIGTKFADVQKGCCIHPYRNGSFELAYLGYARKEKGFFFFLEACEEMGGELAGKIGLVFAAKTDDEEVRNRIKALKRKFADVCYFDGYSKEDMSGILENVHLGVVPVLWEDNLPQVAIEMTAMGIPVLSSDCGGAGELTDTDGFCFRSGDKKDFYEKISALMERPERLEKYFENGKCHVTMQEHIENLLRYYWE